MLRELREPRAEQATSSLPVEVVAALRRMGLLDEGYAPTVTPLKGGVSSDIWRVDLAGGPVCVKRALRRLRVAQEWRAPVERNAYEAAWLRRAAGIVPNGVPRLIDQDSTSGVLVMAYLPASCYPVWKEQLRSGEVDVATAKEVGRRLVAVHGDTARDTAVARQFASDEIFRAIRLEPYLEATARAHPDLAATLHRLSEDTAGTRLALVHGDVSPKNILVGPHGPVFVDAECAWFGDPAFDLAFCLNHLLLKCLWAPHRTRDYLACFESLSASYLMGVDWEERDALEGRAARLLPALLLARVDGKSPVEYLSQPRDKDRVRGVARALLSRVGQRGNGARREGPPVEQSLAHLATIRQAWVEEMTR